jgi:hypothetical protein
MVRISVGVPRHQDHDHQLRPNARQISRAQNLLLIQLKNATTAAERQQIRAELQANRKAFLDALRDFRQQLKR